MAALAQWCIRCLRGGRHRREDHEARRPVRSLASMREASARTVWKKNGIGYQMRDIDEFIDMLEARHETVLRKLRTGQIIPKDVVVRGMLLWTFVVR